MSKAGQPPSGLQLPEARYGLLSTTPLDTPFEKEQQAIYVPPKPTGLKRYLKKYYLLPVAVVVLHTVLLIVGWTFFAMTKAKPVPLPPRVAVWVGENFQPVTMIITLVSSFFAVLATTTYARAIRYAIARRLVGGVSLYTIAVSSKLAGGSVIRKFSRPIWTVIAAVMAIAINAVSSGWTTLVLPKTIEIKSPMSGFEIDMRTLGFQQLMTTNQAKVNVDLFNRVIPVTEASGSNAASAKFGVPSFLNVNGFTYTNSTAGIMPVSIQPLRSNILSATGQQIPANTFVSGTSSTPTPSKLFPVRFSVVQQGFSAHINCTQRPLDTSTIPSLELKTRSEALFDGTNVTLAQMEVGCEGSAGEQSYSNEVLTNGAVDAILAVDCPVGDANDPNTRWDIVLSGFGIYNDIQPTICSVFPELHYVDVAYTDSSSLYNSTTANFVTFSEPRDPTFAPWLGTFAVNVFLRGMKVGQTTTGNMMGDTVLAFMRSTLAASDVDAQSMVLEQYIRGVLELSITLLRTVYTQDGNGLYDGGASIIPNDMRSQVNGTYYATTIGWYQDTQTAPAVLIAPTIVSLVAIGIIVWAVLYARVHPEDSETHAFDPSDVLHLMSASSLGGLKMLFPPFEINDVDKGGLGNVRVSLKEIQEHPGRYGFVQNG